jgi:hypothetical protein
LLFRAVDAREFRGAGHQVVDEDIALEVPVIGDEIRGVRAEGHEAPVGADGAHEARSVCLTAGAVDADPNRRAPLTVPDEDVGASVGVSSDEVARFGSEGNEPPVRACPRHAAVSVAELRGAADAD